MQNRPALVSAGGRISRDYNTADAKPVTKTMESNSNQCWALRILWSKINHLICKLFIKRIQGAQIIQNADDLSRQSRIESEQFWFRSRSYPIRNHDICPQVGSLFRFHWQSVFSINSLGCSFQPTEQMTAIAFATETKNNQFTWKTVRICQAKNARYISKTGTIKA